MKDIQPLFTYEQSCGKSKLPYYRRRDVISHFMLRLACSMSVDSTQRFINRELDLFKIRFSFAAKTESKILKFLADNKIKLEEVGESERKEFRWHLINGNQIKPENFESSKFYKLRFTDCRELVRTRKVFLHLGFCYVTINDLIQFLTQKFRLILSNSMNVSQFFKFTIYLYI